MKRIDGGMSQCLRQEVLRNDEGERIVSTTEKNDISDNSEELIDMIPRSQY